MARKKRKTRHHQPRKPPRALQRRLEEVHRLRKEGKQEEAFLLAERLVKQYPQYPDAWIALLLTTQDDLAYQAWSTLHLTELTPRDAMAWFGLAASAAGLGHMLLGYEAARHYLSLAPRGEFSRETADFVRNLRDEVENLLDRLQEDFSHLTREQIKEFWMLHEKAEIAATVGELETAVQYNRRVLELAPGFTPARNNLATTLFRLGKYEEALHHLRQVREQQPKDGFSLAFLARYTRMLGHDEEANAYMDQLLKFRPMLGDGAFAKLETLAIFGTEEQILQAFEEVQEFEDEILPVFLSRAYHYAAATYARLGDERKARRLWEEALDIDEHNYLAEQNLEDLELPPHERHAPWYFNPELLLPGMEPGEMILAAMLGVSLAREEEEIISLFRSLLDEYPYLPNILSTLLERGDELARFVALVAGIALGTPEAMQTLYNAATDRWGSDQFRLSVLNVLWPDWLPRDRPLTVYLMGKREEFDLPDIKVTLDDIGPQTPDVQILLESAREALTEAPWRSELLYRKMLEMEPEAFLLITDLAVALLFQRRIEEAKSLLAEAVQRYPHVPILRSVQARFALYEDDPNLAEDYLKPLEDVREWDRESWGHYCETRMWLAMYREDPAEVRRWLVWWHLVDAQAYELANRYWDALEEGSMREALRQIIAVPRVKEHKPPRYLEDLDIHVGDRVRVRKGVRDPDFPSHRLAGYTGWVVDIVRWEGDFNVLIAWDFQTRGRIPQTVVRKAEERGLDPNQMWLKMSEVERI